MAHSLGRLISWAQNGAVANLEANVNRAGRAENENAQTSSTAQASGTFRRNQSDDETLVSIAVAAGNAW